MTPRKPVPPAAREPAEASRDGSLFLTAVAIFFGLILPAIVVFAQKGSWR